jgi:hypothetical protein
MTKDLIIVAIGILGMVLFGILYPMRAAAKLARSQPSGPPPVVPSLPQSPRVTEAIEVRPQEIASATALAVAVFVALLGPVWERRYNVDRAVLVSYLVIPPIVAAILLRSRRLELVRWLLATFMVAVIKFLITATIVIAVWALWGPAEEPAAASFIDEPNFEREPPPPGSRTIRGRVLQAGVPIPEAIVYVRSGLERYAFEPSRETVSIENRGDGFSPRLLVVESGQPWKVISKDGRLHTLRAFDQRGFQRFNQSAVSENDTERFVPHAPGLFETSCAVHPNAEKPGRLLVLRHPFHTVTKTDGTFELEVPEVPVQLGAIHAEIEGVELSDLNPSPPP